MLNLNSLLLSSENPKKLVDFYRRVLPSSRNFKRKNTPDMKWGLAS
jgi:hypothetical protein